jgi:hypothetical protein
MHGKNPPFQGGYVNTTKTFSLIHRGQTWQYTLLTTTGQLALTKIKYVKFNQI